MTDKFRPLVTAADLSESAIEVALQMLGKPAKYTVHYSPTDRAHALKLVLPSGCHMIQDNGLRSFAWYVMDEEGNKVGSRGP